MENISDLTLEEVKQYSNILKQYHRGAYGRVYLVQKPNGERHVIKKSLIQDQQFSKYNGIKHEFIISPIHSFKNQTYQFIVFEEWSGNLKQIYENISIQQLLIVLKNLVSALSYLETNGISHGDIKMANILFKKKPFSVGLADFSYISKKQKQYRNDYMQLGLMMMKLMGYDYFQNIDIYQINYLQISEIINNNQAPESQYGNIIWNIIESGVNKKEKKCFAQILSQIKNIQKNHEKTKKARNSKGKFQINKTKKCNSCLKNISKVNYARHIENCKGYKHKKI